MGLVEVKHRRGRHVEGGEEQAYARVYQEDRHQES